MSPTHTENDIIGQVLAGDHQAYSLLVDRYRSLVFTIALRYAKNREDAEEIAQDVFIKAYKSLGGFRGDSKFSTWLYTIANTTCLSFLRKKRPDIQSLDVEGVYDKVSETDSGMQANVVETKSRQSMVNRAIALLGPDDAEIITLFYKAEQTLDEMALALKIETNTAKVRLHRARSRLKLKMEEHFAQEVRDLN